MAEPAPPPEAQLIASRRRDRNLSAREAARRAGVSDGTWRRVESGAQIERPAGTLAQMAAVLGVLPRELADAGRRDAAGALQDIMDRVAAQPGVAEALGPAPEPRGEGWALLMAEIMQAYADIDASHLPDDAKDALRREFLDGLGRDAAERRRQIHSVRRIAGGNA